MFWLAWQLLGVVVALVLLALAVGVVMFLIGVAVEVWDVVKRLT